jgi:phage I-like protein
LLKHLATHAVALPGQAPDWVHLLPVGQFSGKDGRGPYRLPADRVAAVVEHSMAQATAAGLPIDYDHQIDFTRDNGGTAPAAGWITRLEARADGVWGQVEWTPRAVQMVQGKEYRFLSPVFSFKAEDGAVGILMRAGLTNDPNLHLTAIAASEATLNKQDTPSMELNAFLAQLRELFGLPADADATKIAAHAKTLVEGNKQTGASMVAIASALGLQASAKADEIVTKVKAVTENPDPSKFVGIAAFNKLTADFAELQNVFTGKTVAEAVDKAIADGKLIPAQREWATAYATSDLKGFNAYVAAAPQIVKPGAALPGGKPPAGKDRELSDEDLAVCRAMGISADDYKKNL